MRRVKLIALIGCVMLAGCKLDAHANQVQNANRAEAQFEAIHEGMLGADAMQALGEDVTKNGEMTAQVSIPQMAGVQTWTTIRYRLADGSWLYVTYDGYKVVQKQRLFGA